MRSSMALLILTCLAISPVFAQTNYILTTATCPICTEQQISEWQFIWTKSLGVDGRDPVGHKIGPNPAYRFAVGQNWYPIDVYKQTLCGQLVRPWLR